MGTTPNLKLTTISEQDNPKVKDFFQDLAGDVATSNMQKIDEAYGEMLKNDGVFIIRYQHSRYGGSEINYNYSEIKKLIDSNKTPILYDAALDVAKPSYSLYYFDTVLYDSHGVDIGVRFFRTTHSSLGAFHDYRTIKAGTTTSKPIVEFSQVQMLTKTLYDSDGAIKDAGGIAAWSSGNFIPTTEKGEAGGVATLGSDKKVIKEQLPDLNYLPDTSTLEDIPDGATRKAVTQDEKNAWDAKSNFSGSYNDLADKPSLNFIPTSEKGVAGGVANLDASGKIEEIALKKGSGTSPLTLSTSDLINVQTNIKRAEYASFFVHSIYIGGKVGPTSPGVVKLDLKGFDPKEDSNYMIVSLRYSSANYGSVTQTGVFYYSFTAGTIEGETIAAIVLTPNKSGVLTRGNIVSAQIMIFSPKF